MSEKRIVQTPSLFQVDKSFDDKRFMKVRICAMAADTIANGTRFSVECIEAAKDTFANIPVLANVVETQDKDGHTILDYGSHDFHIEQDAFNTDDTRIIYDERVVGVVLSESNNGFEMIKNQKTGKQEVFVDAILYRDYGNYVCDILEQRDGQTSVSMEIDCDDLSANIQDDCIDVGKMIACGVTMLGADVRPAFPTAKAALFSSTEDNRQEQLIQIIQELKESLDNYTAKVEETKTEENKTLGKEEAQMDNKHLEELLEKYEKKVEDLVFDYTEMSDEELDVAFAEAFEKEPVPEKDVEAKQVEMSVTFGEQTKTFAKSLTDVIYALTELVNASYAEEGGYYVVDVFDGGSVKSKYLLMHDLVSGKSYKQSWNLKDGQYVLKGERVEVTAEYLTADELEQLEALRSNYAVMVSQLDKANERLSKYEAEPEKQEILASAAYASIKDSEEYSALMSDHFDISKEDLTAKLDSILLDYAKQGKLDFSEKLEKKVNSKTFPLFANNKGGRYGKIFS